MIIFSGREIIGKTDKGNVLLHAHYMMEYVGVTVEKASVTSLRFWLFFKLLEFYFRF